jgi:hypothetical protein
MQLAMSYAAQGDWNRSLRKIELPMVVDLPSHGRFTVDRRPAVHADTVDPLQFLTIVGECSADPDGFRLVDDLFYADPAETVRAKAIECPEIDQLVEGALSVCGAISFALGAPLEISTLMGSEYPNHFIPESSDDKRKLKELGTGRARAPVSGTRHVETFGDARVDADLIRTLAIRQIPSVYQDVLGSKGPAVRFRALWRVLEFAFQSHGRRLVDLLVGFPPVLELGFDREELEELRSLRGRLSHAASRHGIAEIRRANAEAIASLGRLWSLVDWVTLTKREPGVSLDVEKLQPLAAFIDAGGVVRMNEEDKSPQEWIDTWSRPSPRFGP